MKDKKTLLLIAVCSLLYLMSFFHRVSPTVLALDLMRDFGVSATELGVFSSSTMLAYGLMQLPSGMLADLFGARKTLLCLCALTGLGTIAFALSQTPQTAFLARFVVGMGIAVTVPGVAALAAGCPPQYFVRASSIMLGMGGLGVILAAPPLTALADLFGWRGATMGFGIFSLFLALPVFLLVPERNASEKRFTPADLRPFFTALGAIVRSWRFWCFCLWYMFSVGSYFCMGSLWWGPYLQQSGGLTSAEVGQVLTASAIGLMIAYPLLGYLSDNVFRTRKPIVLVCTCISIAILAHMVLRAGQISLPVFMLSAALYAGCAVSPSTLVYAMVKDSFPPAITGSAIGLCNMSFPIWSSALQYLYGALIQHFGPGNPVAGHQAGIALLLGSCVLAFFFLMLVRVKD